MAKQIKYKKTKGAIDTQDAAKKAIIALDIAGLAAQKTGDAKAMATVGLGWATLAGTVFGIEQDMKSDMEIAELHSDTERLVNPVGFGPRYEEDEDDED